MPRIRIECDHIVAYKNIDPSDLSDYGKMQDIVEDLLDDWFEKREAALFKMVE